MKRFRKVYVEITNICNLNCSFCPGTRRAPQFMMPEKFAQVVEAVKPYTDYIYLHLMGEPLLHPKLGELLECSAAAGLKVNITTNGTLLDSAEETLFAAKNLRKVSVSVHSYEANDPSRTLEAYLEPVFSFAERACKQGILCELRLWNGDGAQMLNGRILNALERRFSLEPLVLVGGQGNLTLGERFYLAWAKKFDWPDPAEDAAEGGVFCYGLRDHIGILCDGTVVPCCLDSEGTTNLGNLFLQPLEEILSSERANYIYEGFSRRKAVEALCKRCGYARRF